MFFLKHMSWIIPLVLITSGHAESKQRISSLNLIPLSSESNTGKVEILPLADQTKALLKVYGFNDKKAYYHIVKKIPRVGSSYHLSSIDNQRIVLSKNSTQTMIKGSLTPIFELNIKDHGLIKLVATDAPLSISESDFRKYEFPNAIKWNSSIKSLNRACGSKIEFKWDDNLTNSLKNRSQHLLETLSELCLKDKDYNEEIVNINKVIITKNTNKSKEMSLSNHTLTLSLSESYYNLKEYVSHWLLQNI